MQLSLRTGSARDRDFACRPTQRTNMRVNEEHERTERKNEIEEEIFTVGKMLKGTNKYKGRKKCAKSSKTDRKHATLIITHRKRYVCIRCTVSV